MRRSCCVNAPDAKTILFAIDQMEKLGITVVSVTDNGKASHWHPDAGAFEVVDNSETKDRFHVFGLADNDEQIRQLSLDFQTEPQV